MIKFHCPSCSQKLGVPDDYAGKRIRCSKCSQPAFVPHPEIVITPAAAKPLPTIPSEIEQEPLSLVIPKPETSLEKDNFLLELSPPTTEEVGTLPVTIEPKSCASEDRQELVFKILTTISIIGPLAILFGYVLFCLIWGLAAMHDPTAMPNAFNTPHAPPTTADSHSGSVWQSTLMVVMMILPQLCYAFGIFISPLATLLSLVYMYWRNFDIPRRLRFALVFYGFLLLFFLRYRWLR
jgi:hypothetical protein